MGNPVPDFSSALCTIYQPEGILRLQWVQSASGPLLLLAGILRADWTGTESPRSSRPIEATFRFSLTGSVTDYGRASDAGRGQLGIISVGRGQALVLGAASLATTWIPEQGGPGGWLVRREQADSDADAERALVSASAAEWIAGPTFRTLPGEHYLFDAGIPGRDIGMAESLLIPLRAPQYRLSTGYLRPNRHTSLLIHRLLA